MSRVKETIVPKKRQKPSAVCTEDMPVAKAAKRHALEDYRMGGLAPNCDPAIALAISEALMSQIKRKNVESGLDDIRWAVTLFNRSRLVDQRIKSDHDSLKLRRLSLLIEEAKTLMKTDDHHFIEVVKYLGSKRNISLSKAQNKALDFLHVMSVACANVDRSRGKAKKLPDIATDIAVAHLIRAWEMTLHRGPLQKRTLGYTSPAANDPKIDESFTFNFERGERPKKTDGFVYPSMKFLQLAFAIIDQSVPISRIRTAAEKVSKSRTVKNKSVEKRKKN